MAQHTKRILTNDDAREFLSEIGIEVEGDVVEISGACQRCGGSGYGHWIQDGGMCYDCQGRNTKNVVYRIPVKKYAQKEKAKHNARERKRLQFVLEKIAGLRKLVSEHREDGLLEDLKTDDPTVQSIRCNAHWGLSEAQVALVRKLAEKARAPKPIQATVPVTNSRIEITGEIVTVKTIDTMYGSQNKMLVKVTTDEGDYKLWGTAPAAIYDACEAHFDAVPEGGYYKALRGHGITFTARVEPSRDDESFGYFNRPTKVKIMWKGE